MAVVLRLDIDEGGAAQAVYGSLEDDDDALATARRVSSNPTRVLN